MNFINLSALTASIFIASTANCSLVPKMPSFMSKTPTFLTKTPSFLSKSSASPLLFTLTRPMACSETKDKSTFVAALKLNKDNISKLAAILNCPKANALIKDIDESDLKENNVLPDALKNALLNKHNEIQYGYLQLDNDRSFKKCVSMIKAMELESICASESCTKAEITAWGTKLTTDKQNYGPCNYFFMKERIDEMVTKIIGSFDGDTKARSQIISDINAIMATAPIMAARAGILVNKQAEKTAYDSRNKLIKILEINVPEAVKKELSVDLEKVASEEAADKV